MRIAWFTSLAQGDPIALFSEGVVRALAQCTHIEVWADLEADVLNLDCCPVHGLAEPASCAQVAEEFDICVYNLGPRRELHGRVFDAYQHGRGLVIAHATSMHEFFLEPRDRYLKLMRCCYGKEGAEFALNVLDGVMGLGDPRLTERHTLIEPCFWNAEAVVSHSNHVVSRAVGRYGDLMPAHRLRLPVSDRDSAESEPRFTEASLDLRDDRSLAVSCGPIGPTSCVQTVIDALAGDRDVSASLRVMFVGCGASPEVESLRREVAAQGLLDTVGFVPEADVHLLRRYIQRADVCINLFPSTDAGSGVLAEQMSAGKPIIAFDMGMYTEPCGGYAHEVPYTGGAAALASGLKTLVRDDSVRALYSRRSFECASETCTPQAYAGRLMAVMSGVLENRDRLRSIDDAAAGLGSRHTLRGLERSAKALSARLVGPTRTADATPKHDRGWRPTVSILTPSFNQAAWLADNLRSVAEQTYPAIEHVVMDGGSTDDSLRVLSEAGSRVVWRSEPDRGQAHAVNKAFAASSGEIIGWLNSDDALYDEHVVRDVVSFFRRHPGVDVVYGHAAKVAADGRIIYLAHVPLFDYTLMQRLCPLIQPAVFMRRSALSEIGFLDESYQFAMDWELWLRLATTHQFVRINRVLAIDRVQPGRKIKKWEPILHENAERLAARYGVRWPLNVDGLGVDWIETTRRGGAWHALTRPRRLVFGGVQDDRWTLLKRQLSTDISDWPPEFL